MYFDHYFVNSDQHVKFNFLNVPPSSYGGQKWSMNRAGGECLITMDLMKNDKNFNILISSPDWSLTTISSCIERISSNLLVMFKAFGLIDSKSLVQWYIINHSFMPLTLERVEFEEKNSWLTTPKFKKLGYNECPFNISELKDLFD